MALLYTQFTRNYYPSGHVLETYKSMPMLEQRRVYGRARKYMGSMEYRLGVELGFLYEDDITYSIDIAEDLALQQRIKTWQRDHKITGLLGDI